MSRFDAIYEEHECEVCRTPTCTCKPRGTYLRHEVDAEDSTRIGIVPVEGRGQITLAEYDEGSWQPVDEAWLDPTGLRALAAMALIVAEELDRTAANVKPGGWGPK